MGALSAGRSRPRRRSSPPRPDHRGVLADVAGRAPGLLPRLRVSTRRRRRSARSTSRRSIRAAGGDGRPGLRVPASSNLAAAYGVAVTTTMVITTVLTFTSCADCGGGGCPWPPRVSGLFPGDRPGLLRSEHPQGARWRLVPSPGRRAWGLLVTTCAPVGSSSSGSASGRSRRGLRQRDKAARPARAGHAGVLTSHPDVMPAALPASARVQRLHQHVIFFTVVTRVGSPSGPPSRGGHEAEPALFGWPPALAFSEDPTSRGQCAVSRTGAGDRPERHLLLLGRETLLASPRPGMALWREHLFTFMARNAPRPTDSSNPVRPGARGRRPDRAVSPRCWPAPQATGSLSWWRRWESNPRPKTLSRRRLRR